MAVAFDAVGGGVASAAHGTTAQTWSHTISAASDVAVILGFSVFGGVTWANDTPTAVTFGGQAMTFLGFVGDNNVNSTSSFGYSAIYYLLNPTSRGAQTVSVTGKSGGGAFWSNTVSYTGVGSLGSAVTNFGSSAAPTTGAVTSATGHMVVSIGGSGTGGETASTPTKTSRYTWASGLSSHPGYLQDAAGAATVTTAFTLSGSGAWGYVAVDLAPPAVSNLFFAMF